MQYTFGDLFYLTEHYIYHPDGDLYRIRRWGKPCEPEIPYKVTNNAGYYSVNVQSGRVHLHTAIWAYHYLRWPPKSLQIDHIDRNKLNNRIENLRLLTKLEQGQNVSLSVKSTSGYRNICFHKPSGLWRVVFTYNGTNFTKYYKTKEEAIDARDPLINPLTNRERLLCA